MRLIYSIATVAIFISCNQPKTNNDIVQKDTVVINSKTVLSDTDITAVHAVDTVTKDRLIVPGKSVGLSSIDEKAESIGAKLGTPDEGDAAMGKAISTWRSKTNKAHSTTIYFTTNFGDKEEAKRVQQIRITSPYFSTKEKIAVGSSIDDVKRSFSSLIKTGFYPLPSDVKQSVNVFDDATAGIAFEIDPSNKCVGITIHKPGEKPFETYLNFLEGYKPVN